MKQQKKWAKRHIRSAIVEMIEALIPFDSLEREHIAWAKEWVTSGLDIFRTKKPDVPPVHLVSLFILFDVACQELLLVDHKRANLWLAAGGHVEVDEHPQETVRREAEEELGIEADFLFEDPLFLAISDTGSIHRPHRDVQLWFLLKGCRKELLAWDAREFNQIQWFPIQKIPLARSDPHLARFLDKLSSLNGLLEGSASD